MKAWKVILILFIGILLLPCVLGFGRLIDPDSILTEEQVEEFINNSDFSWGEYGITVDTLNITGYFIYGDIYMDDFFSGPCPAGQAIQSIDEWGDFSCTYLGLNLSGTNANQNIDVSPWNLTAGYFIGDGAYLTNLNVSGNFTGGNFINYSGYTNQNVFLSDGTTPFNLTVGGSIRTSGAPLYLMHDGGMQGLIIHGAGNVYGNGPWDTDDSITANSFIARYSATTPNFLTVINRSGIIVFDGSSDNNTMIQLTNEGNYIGVGNITAGGLNVTKTFARFSGNMENERGSLGYPNVEIGEDTYPTIIFDDGADTWMIDFLTGSGLRFYQAGNVHMIINTQGILTDENVTASWFKGKFNWTSEDNWNIFDGSTLTFNDTKLLGEVWFFTVNVTISGTSEGTLEETQQYDDYDSVSYNLTEAVPGGLEYYANTSADVSTEVNKICIRYLATGDDFDVSIYDTDLTDWEGYMTLTSNIDFVWVCADIRDSSHHLVDDKIMLRIINAYSASTQHKLYIDAMYVSSGYTPRIGNEVDPLSIHADGDNPLTGNWNTGGFNITNISYLQATIGNFSILYAGIGNMASVKTTGVGLTGEFTDILVDGDIYIPASIGGPTYRTIWRIDGPTLTDDRYLFFLTGDADRTLTLTGSPTLGDWFNQSVKTTSNVTHHNLSLTGDLSVDGTISGTNTEWDDAYTHSTDNSQAHTDYLINNANDETTGVLTMAGLISNRVVKFQSNIAADGYMTAIWGADVNANTLTDNTRKFCRMGMYDYDIDEQPVAFFFGDVQDATSKMHIGGGNSAMNAFTDMYFYAADDTTTTTGTEIIHLDTTGIVVSGNVTAEYYFGNGSFLDETPSFLGNSQDAHNLIMNINSVDGQIDHSTLPDFARMTVNVTWEECTEGTDHLPDCVEKSEIREYRDLGAMITLLTDESKWLDSKINDLKQENQLLKEAICRYHPDDEICKSIK